MTDNFIQPPIGYSNFLENFKETNNVIYNIINYQEPQTIFLYGFILIVFIYASSFIDISTSLLILLIFYSILIYYLYTDKKVNHINEFEKLNTKYELLNTDNNVLKKYPNIIDFLFYMSELKIPSPRIYYEIQQLFKQFILLYEACLHDINLINDNYETLVSIKDYILFSINSYTFNLLTNDEAKKLYEMRNAVEKMLNNFLGELVVLQKKDIYYNDYNTKTKIIKTDNIKPFNFLDTNNQYVRNTKQYDVLNLYLL
jgi:hypothetical protein